MTDKITIGTSNGIDVNVFYSTMTGRDFNTNKKTVYRTPVVEIRRASSVRMRLPEVEAVIDLLQEALAFWQEESYILTDCDEISNKS